MANEEETPEVEQDDAPVEEPKAKKPRKPRKPKAAKAAKAEPEDADVEEDDFELKKGEQFVRQEGKTLTLSGKGVVLNGLSKADIQKWSIESVSGTVGKPCKEPLVITFKNRKAALAFFDACLDDESEDDEVITTSSAVKWFSEELGI